jgi:thiol-disulfide isomerase/thioredoxin
MPTPSTVFSAALLAALVPALFAQASQPLPGCEPRSEVRRILDDKLSEEVLQRMKFPERVAFRRQVLEGLIAKYPGEVEPYRRLIQATRQEDTDNFPALLAGFRKQAEQHPDNPVALYAAGLALSGVDTPASIRFLEQARSEAPKFAWPALELANIYGPGTKRADKKKSADEIADFFEVCPASTDADAQHRLRPGSKELQTRVAQSVRARLAKETEPQRLKDYETLWSLEFRTRPAEQHDAVRKQVAADLDRLEGLNAHPDAAWLVFLKDGYKQAGASPEIVAGYEDRVIQAFPHSDQAYQIVRERWEKAHKEPESQADAAGWAKYHGEFEAALQSWIARFTEAPELQHKERFYAVSQDPSLPAEESLRAVNDYLAYIGAYERPSINSIVWAASILIDHNWQPRRVFDLLRNSEQLMDQWHARVVTDNLVAETEEMWDQNEVALRQAAAGEVLKAARLAEQPAEAQRFKPFIERDLPPKTWEVNQTRYWLNRGRLALLEGSKADALTYYQQALHARKKPPNPFQGRVNDDVMEEARALWKQMDGTETAWNVWSKPPAKVMELAGNGWTKPAKPMPAFELADLSGKTWRLKSLEGRAVLINVWATWCGPCQAELPHLEKLYERIKDRADLQILTLTIDEDLGLVAPFMKEKGYTFPVLPAYSFVAGLLDLVAIPQNWIIDTKGEWRWTGGPSVSDAEWEAAMLKQLESAKQP